LSIQSQSLLTETKVARQVSMANTDSCSINTLDLKSIDVEEEELDNTMKEQSDLIFKKITQGERPISILITGASNNGKSSLVQAILGENTPEKLVVGYDGTPTTMDVTAYMTPDGKLEVIDTPGLEKKRDKNQIKQIQKQLKQKQLKPDIVCVVLNNSGSIEESELDLVNLVPEKPAIIVLNKCDFLHGRKEELKQDSTCLERFDLLEIDELPEWMRNNKALMGKRDRLLKWKPKNELVRRIVLTTLTDSLSETIEPIGVEAVIEALFSCLDKVGQVQFAQIQLSSKLGKIKASVAFITASVAAASGEYACSGVD
jgi:small GTP-binding protein